MNLYKLRSQKMLQAKLEFDGLVVYVMYGHEKGDAINPPEIYDICMSVDFDKQSPEVKQDIINTLFGDFEKQKNEAIEDKLTGGLE